MTNKYLATVSRCCIVIIALCGLAVCAFWYPFSISLTTVGVVPAQPTLEQNIEFWTQLAFYWLTSAPCFVILLFMWIVTNNILRNKFFSKQTTQIIKNCVLILSIDLAVFFVGNVLFSILQWNDFAILYFIIALIGLALVGFAVVMYHYVLQAVTLKEEMELTV